MGVRQRAEAAKKAWWKLLRLRSYHYRKTFRGESGAWVLSDIAQDAKINEALFNPDSRLQDWELGYRACALRITRILKLTPIQIDRLTDQGKPDDDD